MHSAADGGQVECLELLIEKGYDVNALLHIYISGRTNRGLHYSTQIKPKAYFIVCIEATIVSLKAKIEATCSK